MIARLLAVLALVATPLVAQKVADPMELVRLQPVLEQALDHIAPSVVRIETFGGARRVLGPDAAPADGVAPAQRFRYTPRDLQDLFDKIDPDELNRLWREKGLEPKEEGEPFEPRDLSKLGEETLKQLFERYGIEPGKTPPEGGGDQKKPGPLRPPGFLQAQGATTGVVLTSDGWIVVSRFALNFDPSTILVTLADGRSFTARRGGEDTSRGIALIKIDAENLPVPEFVAPDTVRVGEWAFVAGRTFAPTGRPSVHVGIVSAVGRLFGRAVQIDAYTSPANYGGPVIDVRGHVMGVAVPLSPSGRDAGVDWYDSGVGFATTIADIGELLERMKQGEELDRGWLGIALDSSGLGPGAQVAQVVPESPAAGVGLRKDDVIVAVDGTDVLNTFHLQTLLGAHMAGDPVNLKVRRGDEEIGVTVFLAAVPVKEREAQTRKEETFQLPWEGDPPPADGGR